MPLTADRDTKLRGGEVFEPPVKAATKIFAGALVCLDASGWAVPGAETTGLKAAGRAEKLADNSGGANGDIAVRVMPGIFRWKNSAGGDEIAAGQIGNVCYIVDDETVAKTSDGGARSRAGVVVDVDDLGVWVRTGYAVTDTPSGSLLVDNNLDDVADAATAFANIKQAATASATGAVELATTAETRTGTDEARAVTPKGAADSYMPKYGAPAFSIGDEANDVRNVAVQIKDAAGENLAVRTSVLAYLSTDAGGGDLVATAPDGGVAIGSKGVAIPLVAGKAFQLVTHSDGIVDIDIEESGAATYRLVLVMPDGKLVVSGAIAFAT